MKKSNRNAEESDLRPLLQEWKVKPDLPPGFQQRVWARISTLQERAPFRQAWREMLDALTTWVAQPKFAAAYVGLFLIVGLGGGWASADSKNEQIEAALKNRYVQAVDPYQMPRN